MATTTRTRELAIVAECEDCGKHLPIGMLKETGDGYVLCSECFAASNVCSFCKTVHYKDDFTTAADGKSYCEDCIEERFIRCNHCEEYYFIDNVDGSYASDGEWYCEDCIEVNFARCCECGDVFYRREVNTIDGNYYCEECTDNIFMYCDECLEYHEISLLPTCDWCGALICMRNTYHDEQDTTLCHSCYENSYCCDDCGEFVREENIIHAHSHTYCEYCYTNGAHIIHSYSYKPSPIFFGRKSVKDLYALYLGVEWEVDYGDDRNCFAESLSDISEVYCKFDGSLDEGVEVVTHPCTLDYHMEELPWKEIITQAKEYNFRSHDTVTCGLHVHLSRTGFGDNYDLQDKNIAKLVYLFEKFWGQIKKFSRRTEENLSRWAQRYGLCVDVDTTYNNAKGSGRRYAVNLCNSETVEIRVFRGTLNLETLMASLQFCKLLVDAVVYGTNHDIQNLEWKELVMGAREYPELSAYLKRRGLA